MTDVSTQLNYWVVIKLDIHKAIKKIMTSKYAFLNIQQIYQMKNKNK